MGIFDKNKGKKDLDEIKRLATGEKAPQKPQVNPQNQTKAVPSSEQVKKDVEAFKEEQKIFSQISSHKELPSEGSYDVPKELNNPTDQKEKSAFEKLMSYSKTGMSEDTKNKTITSPTFAKPIVTPNAEEKIVIPNSKGVEIKNESDTKPQIKPAQTNDTSQKKDITKNIEFDWMKSENIEEPNENDFEETTQKNSVEKLNMIKTPIDDMFEALQTNKILDTDAISKISRIDSGIVEQIAKLFEEDGVLQIEYPASLTKKPTLRIKNPVQTKFAPIPKGKIIESYTINVDFVPANILIIKSIEDARPAYTIEMAAIGKYTKRFLDFIKDEVAENMPIDLEEILDTKKSKKLKERFFNELSAHLLKYFPQSTAELRNMLSGVLLHEMYGLGDIEVLLGDDMLEEIGINSSKTCITVYHRVYGWLKTNLYPGTEEEINNLASQIGRKVGRDITVLNPILDAHLLSGDRVNATLFPISSEGNTITIRRFARKPWTIVDLIGNAHTMSTDMAAMLWLAMQYEMNVIIAGGTASGKTSALNSLLALVPTYHRIISIEDVREIVLPKYLEWNWIPLVTRSANPEGLGEVTMLDLMVSSLRMRPDRIIVGEMRRKKEAEVLMEAIETGHSIYSTIHANSAYQVLRRLAEPPMSIPLMQIELIDLIVVQYRDRKTNKRRTYEISEIEQTSTGQGLQVNTVFKWVPRTDAWERLNKPTKLITLLNLHTGMTEEDINTEIEQRKQILEWMKKQNITDLDTIGFLVKLFYSEPSEVNKMAQKNTSVKKVEEIMEEHALETKQENM